MRHFWHGVCSVRKQWRIKISIGETSFITVRPLTKPTVFLWRVINPTQRPLPDNSHSARQTYRHTCPGRDSNPQQASGRRPPWDRQKLQLQPLPLVVRQRNIISSWDVLYCPLKEWLKEAGRPECEGIMFC